MIGKPLAIVVATLMLSAAKNFGVLGQRVMSSSMAGVYSTAFVTVPDETVAKTLAHNLVKNKLAACVNIIPNITSVYEWENKINEDSELMLAIHTRTEAVEELTEFVRKNHPYKVCQVISMPIEKGNKPYLDWIGSIVPAAAGKSKSE